jgi:hypothetical protein
LLGGCDREAAPSDLDEATAFKFVLEQLALGLCALKDGIGVAERIGKRRVSKVVKAGWGYGRNVVTLIGADIAPPAVETVVLGIGVALMATMCDT